MSGFSVNTKESGKTKEYWASAEDLSPETQAAIAASSVVLVPTIGIRENVGPTFPVGTTELFHFLQEKLPNSVEIAIEDSEYKELALHSELIILAKLAIELIAAPTICGLLVEYLKERLGTRMKAAEVEASITVTRTDGNSSQGVEINYKGPAESFESAIQPVLLNIKSDGSSKSCAPAEKPKELEK